MILYWIIWMLRCQHKLSLQAEYFKFLLARFYTLVALQETSGSHCLFGAISSVAVNFISIVLCSMLLFVHVIIMAAKDHTVPQKLEIIRTLESGKS
jgi:hypothetical protein